MKLKDTILQIAASMGFQRTVIAALSPMEEARVRYQNWLDKGYAAKMDYLKRDPHFRTSPADLVPGACSAIIVSLSYFSPPPQPPGHFVGRVAGYAVGLDYHIVLQEKLVELKERLEQSLGRSLLSKVFSDNCQLYEHALAKRHGLGFTGKNSLLIGPKLSGSYNFVGELFTDLELEPDEAYAGTCGNCFRCGAACPTDAIESPGLINANKCISYLTIENKEGIPLHLRPQLGNWIFGCDICQEVCPYNQSPPETPWLEFRPESGVGHYLDLSSLLQIKTDAEFRLRFKNTALLRPKRRGMLRNALIVLGNCLRQPNDNHHEVERVVALVVEFIQNETDPMLREHAIWSLAQSENSFVRQKAKRLIVGELDKAVVQSTETYIES